jgi:hypothetical protein
MAATTGPFEMQMNHGPLGMLKMVIKQQTEVRLNESLVKINP